MEAVTAVTQTLWEPNEDISNHVLGNEWQTTGTFPFIAKSKTLKKGTLIAYVFSSHFHMQSFSFFDSFFFLEAKFGKPTVSLTFRKNHFQIAKFTKYITNNRIW